MTTPSEPLYREIPLTQGQVALVDAADYEWLMQWEWHDDRRILNGIEAIPATILSES